MLPFRRVLATARPSTLRASRSTVPCATWRTRAAVKTYSTAAEEKIEEKTEEKTPVETAEQATPADTTEAPTPDISETTPSVNETSENSSATLDEAPAPKKWSFAAHAAERKALKAQVVKETTRPSTRRTTSTTSARTGAAGRIAAKKASAATASRSPTDPAADSASTTTTTSNNTPTKAATPSKPLSKAAASRPHIRETVRRNFLPNFSPKAAARTGPNDLSEVDWQTSYMGISEKPVYQEAADVLLRPLADEDVEVKPDGIIYLPEIKYRRRLTEAFGPMGWGLIPRGEAVVGTSIVTREYCLIVDGRFVAQAQGENQYFGNDQLPSAVEGCKSNALMRCCKDLGIASELWDPSYIRWFREHHMESRWVEHTVNKKKKQFWFKKGVVEVPYPWKVTK